MEDEEKDVKVFWDTTTQDLKCLRRLA